MGGVQARGDARAGAEQARAQRWAPHVTGGEAPVAQRRVPVVVGTHPRHDRSVDLDEDGLGEPVEEALLVGTWWSDIASTPRSAASRRMVSAARPSASARAIAAASTRAG